MALVSRAGTETGRRLHREGSKSSFSKNSVQQGVQFPVKPSVPSKLTHMGSHGREGGRWQPMM